MASPMLTLFLFVVVGGSSPPDDISYLVFPNRFAPAANNTIRIGVSAPLTGCTVPSRRKRCLGLVRGYELFFSWLDKIRGGIWVGGVLRPVELLVADDQYNASRVSRNTQHLIQDKGIQLLLGTYSSPKSIFMVRIMDRFAPNSSVIVLPSASAPPVFGRPNVYGTLSATITAPDAGFEAAMDQFYSASPTTRAVRKPRSVVYVWTGDTRRRRGVGVFLIIWGPV